MTSTPWERVKLQASSIYTITAANLIPIWRGSFQKETRNCAKLKTNCSWTKRKPLDSTTWLRQQTCLKEGMNNFLMVLFAVQVAIALIAFFRENGKDERFEDDKIGFRS
jgi:hypothetical protein